MGKHKKQRGLTQFIDAAEERRLKEQIIERKPGKLESERVLVCDDPALIYAIIKHVTSAQDIFVTLDHPDLAPGIPAGFDEEFVPAIEITAPRERSYFLDRDGILRKLECEVRQEIKAGGCVRQTTKIGDGATEDDSTMDRIEQASMILSFGFNVFAIGDSDVRKAILEQAESIPRPVLRMVSQRHRIPYHPEGDPCVVIEMALEPTHVGQTFTGFTWRQPKIDLEIIRGPDENNRKARHELLAREEARLLRAFPDLRRQLRSSPSLGFDSIQEALAKKKWKHRF